jgi:hypothetical protein
MTPYVPVLESQSTIQLVSNHFPTSFICFKYIHLDKFRFPNQHAKFQLALLQLGIFFFLAVLEFEFRASLLLVRCSVT